MSKLDIAVGKLLEEPIKEIERRKQSLQAEIVQIKKDIKSERQEFDNYMRQEKEVFENSVAQKEKELKKREAEVARKEKEVGTRHEASLTIKEDFDRLQKKRKEVAELEKAADEAKKHYLVSQKKADLLIAQYTKKSEELAEV